VDRGAKALFFPDFTNGTGQFELPQTLLHLEVLRDRAHASWGLELVIGAKSRDCLPVSELPLV
jgi:hypothetical protein